MLTILLTIILAHPFALIAAHRFVAGVIAWVAFAAVVDGMPAPGPTSGVAYRWLHASLNLLAGNLVRVLCAFYPRFAALIARNPTDSKE